jgi:hypothetical protein
MGYKTGLFLVGFTFDNSVSDDEVFLLSASVVRLWTIWPDGGREPKSNSRFNKEQNDEP